MKCLSIFLLVAFLHLHSAEAGGGLVLFSAKGASYVTAVQYESFSSPSSNLAYITVKGGKRMQIPTDSLVGQVLFPAASGVTAADAESAISQTEMLAARYPQHAKLLQSVGELWKRSLEASKKAQAMPVAVASGTPDIGPKIIMPGSKSEIPILRTKSGQTFKNVTITQFENDKAAVTHSTGMGRIPISDFSDLSNIPPDAKAAIEKAQAAVAARQKAEADRIAREKQEEERLVEVARKAEADRVAKEKQEEDRLAEVRRIAEVDRIAKEKQEQKEAEEMSAHADEVLFRTVLDLQGDLKKIADWIKASVEADNILQQGGILAPRFSKMSIEELQKSTDAIVADLDVKVKEAKEPMDRVCTLLATMPKVSKSWRGPLHRKKIIDKMAAIYERITAKKGSTSFDDLLDILSAITLLKSSYSEDGEVAR